MPASECDTTITAQKLGSPIRLVVYYHVILHGWDGAVTVARRIGDKPETVKAAYTYLIRRGYLKSWDNSGTKLLRFWEKAKEKEEKEKKKSLPHTPSKEEKNKEEKERSYLPDGSAPTPLKKRKRYGPVGSQWFLAYPEQMAKMRREKGDDWVRYWVAAFCDWAQSKPPAASQGLKDHFLKVQQWERKRFEDGLEWCGWHPNGPGYYSKADAKRGDEFLVQQAKDQLLIQHSRSS